MGQHWRWIYQHIQHLLAKPPQRLPEKFFVLHFDGDNWVIRIAEQQIANLHSTVGLDVWILLLLHITTVEVTCRAPKPALLVHREVDLTCVTSGECRVPLL
jgi:hypothetical protein